MTELLGKTVNYSHKALSKMFDRVNVTCYPDGGNTVPGFAVFPYFDGET